MTDDELRQYGKWLQHSPQQVIQSVIGAGGWRSIFHGSVPTWANKVRNYFNETPKSLRRFGDQLSAKWLKKAQKYLQREETYRLELSVAFTVFDALVKAKDLSVLMKTLSGDVYIDESKRIWYQMSPGGAIYHYGSQPSSPTVEAIWAHAKSQAFCPVFKLVSPDGTGGSRECIIDNPVLARVWVNGIIPMDIRSSVIGAEMETVDVSKRIVTDPVLQGSYNYSETIEVGLDEHEERDVKPHVADPSFYVNPFPPSSSLSMRRFPKTDNHRNVIAHQLI
jgi:hypothetical protein